MQKKKWQQKKKSREKKINVLNQMGTIKNAASC
jgi:hypothetical protein